jgi:hypothetical protein
MEAWETAWLECQPMPPHVLPRELKQRMQTIAEAWLAGNSGPRVHVEEWVSRKQAYDVMDGLLWTGFRLKRQPEKRIRPVPVCIQMLYQKPPPIDARGLRQQMRLVLNSAFREWGVSREQLGDDIERAP